MQFGPHRNPEEITDQLLRLVREAPIDEVMFFYFGEELNDGHETLERLRLWIDASRPYRDALKKAGVAISLNPWHSMLHCDRGRKLKPGQNWQRMVDPAGREAGAVVCCLDPGWQAYYFETLRLYAKEGFRVVWIDDDIRYHNHDPLHWGGCFCPGHVAEFGKRAGVSATREEIVKACLRPGTPHPWRNIWMDMWQETILTFLIACRRILESSGTRMGLMSSSMEAHAAEGRQWGEWWQAFAGGRPPVHRPHFWPYSDTIGPSLIHGIAALDQNRTIQPACLESGPEIENFPYGRWNKSFRQTFAQIAVAHILGSGSLNISLFDFMGNQLDDEPERVAFLKSARPDMDWLADNFPMSLKSQGVGVPWSENMGRLMHTKEGKSWYELHCPSRSWSYWLGAAGIAFSSAPRDCVNALSGPLAHCFDDATLTQWLASGLLLDGEALAILMERGFGKWLGVESVRFVTQEETCYSIEECRDPDFARRAGGQISVNIGNHMRRLLQAELRDGANVISVLRGPAGEVVGHGAFTFQNTLGGRVAVVPWDAGADMAPMMDIHRATQLKCVVEWLAGGKNTGSVEGGAWLVPQFLKSGSIWRGVVWNASPDEVVAFRVHRPAGMPPIREAWHLTPTGHRQALSVEGDAVHLHHPLHQWELVVMW